MAPKKTSDPVFLRRPISGRNSKQKRGASDIGAENTRKKQKIAESQTSTQTESEQLRSVDVKGQKFGTPQETRSGHVSLSGTPLKLEVPSLPSASDEIEPRVSRGNSRARERNVEENHPDAQALHPMSQDLQDTDEHGNKTTSGDQATSPSRHLTSEDIKVMLVPLLDTIGDQLASTIVETVIAKLDAPIESLTTTVKSLESCIEKQSSMLKQSKDQLDTLTSAVVSIMRSKNVKSQHDVTFFGLKKMCSSTLFRAKLTGVFNVTILSAFSKKGDQSQSNTGHAVVENADVSETAKKIRAIFFCRQPSEPRKTARDEPLMTPHASFRKNFIYVFFASLCRDEDIGREHIMKGSRIVDLAKPEWVHPDFLNSKIIENMLITDFPDSFNTHTSEESQHPTHEDQKELARRINLFMTQHLNKGREHSRIATLESFGFMWEDSVGCQIISPSGEDVDMTLGDIPMALDASSDHSSMNVSRNRKIWEDLLTKSKTFMTATISYEVRIFANSNKQGNFEKRVLRTTLNYMNAALLFCLRFTGNVKSSDFFVTTTKSFKAVFAVACVFRMMAITQWKMQSDEEHTDDEIYDMECFLRAVLPPPSSRESVIQEVTALSDEEYTRKNISSSAGGSSRTSTQQPIPEQSSFDVDMRDLIG